MNIGTLNLNGETYFSINRRPRLPESLFSIKNIKRSLVDLTKEKLVNMLNDKSLDLDILAVQEFVNSLKEREEIEEALKKEGYILLAPKIQRNHFVTGFIVKESKRKYFNLVELSKQEDDSLNLSPNRICALMVKIRKESILIINVHINNYKFKIVDVGDKQDCNQKRKKQGNIPTILLGDMNACSKNQTSKKIAVNGSFIESLSGEYDECVSSNNEKLYTWKSNDTEKQLDHVFVSKNFQYETDLRKIDNTNFYYNKDGFTDHSMLVLNVKNVNLPN